MLWQFGHQPASGSPSQPRSAAGVFRDFMMLAPISLARVSFSSCSRTCAGAGTIVAIYISIILKLFENVEACMHSSAIDCHERVEPPTAISAPILSRDLIAPILVRNAVSYARLRCINVRNSEDGISA